MAIDMSQFHQVFFDETEEHLAAMESLLLAMDVAHPEQEDLHAVFRAAHSIKGGAATFGFSEMAELTHVLENLLDRVRKGAMGLTVEMVDAFLQAKDALQSMLGAYKNGEEPDGGRQEEIQRQLEAIESQAPEAETAASPQDAAPAAEQLWTLFLELTPADEHDIRPLLENLAAQGDLTIVQEGRTADELPWVAVFTSSLEADEVAESLAFMLPPERFRVSMDRGGGRRRRIRLLPVGRSCVSRQEGRRRSLLRGRGWRLRSVRAAARSGDAGRGCRLREAGADGAGWQFRLVRAFAGAGEE